MYNSNGREKNPEDRARRNAETYVIDRVEWDGVRRGPDLPEGYGWGAMTLRWWETWRSSPQSMVMTDLDWEFMLDTARLYDTFWNFNGAISSVQLASELRQRMAKFGVTYEDRKKLRMSLDVPMSSMTEDDEVVAVVNYAERLTKKGAK